MSEKPADQVSIDASSSYRNVPTNFPIKDGAMKGTETAAHSSDGRVVVRSLEQFIGRELPNRQSRLGRYSQADGSVDCPFLFYRFKAIESEQETVEPRNLRLSVCLYYRLTTSADRSWLRDGYKYPDSGSIESLLSPADYIPEALLALDTMFGRRAGNYLRFDAFQMGPTDTFDDLQAQARAVLGSRSGN